MDPCVCSSDIYTRRSNQSTPRSSLIYLRRRYHLEKGTRGVLIEFEERFDNVLLTEFGEWHMVLNTNGDEEYQREMIIISPDEVYPWHEIIINPADEERVSKSIVQAVLCGLDIKNVTNVKEFTAR